METDRINQSIFFSSLAPETRLAISRRAFIRDLPAGFSLLIEGMPAESCYFMLAGDTRALRMNSEGRVQVLARCWSCKAARF